MSWQDAKAEADRIYDELRAKSPVSYVEMVLRAMQRRLSREQQKQKKDEKGDAPGGNDSGKV